MKNISCAERTTATPAMRAAAVAINNISPADFIRILNLIRNADNTQGTQELPITGAGTFQFTLDAQGNVSLTSAPTVQPIHTNDLTLDATAIVGTVKTITFTAPMPDAAYAVIPQMNGLAGALAVVPGSLTAAGYQVKITALIVGTVTLVAVHKG